MNKKEAKFFPAIFGLFKQTAEEWMADKAPQLGAALAYYTVFPLAPLVLILLALIGLIFRHNPAGAWNRMVEEMSYFLDQSAIKVVRDIAQNASAPAKGFVATSIGVALALFGASGVFWPASRCAQRNLGRQGETGHWTSRVFASAFPFVHNGGGSLFSAAGFTGD